MLGIGECDMYARTPDTWGDAVLLSLTPLWLLAAITGCVLGWLVWQLIRGGD